MNYSTKIQTDDQARRYVLLVIIVMAALFMPGLSGQAVAQVYPQKNVHLTTVVFGDLNTQDFAGGIKNWYEVMQTQLGAPTSQLHFTYNNQAVGGKSMAPTMLGAANAQYDINGALSHIGVTDLGFVMLGTNDAYRGVAVADYVNSYKAFISAVKASGKVGRLVILTVPPMTAPYNCLTGCFPFPTNPQVDRVGPYNQQLNALKTYCASISFKCDVFNSSGQIPLNATYIDPNTGIHLLNPAQSSVATSVINGLKNLTLQTPSGNKKAQ